MQNARFGNLLILLCTASQAKPQFAVSGSSETPIPGVPGLPKTRFCHIYDRVSVPCERRYARTALPRVGSRTRRHPQADRRVIARKSGVRCAREPLANAGGSFRNETSGAKKVKCFTLGLKGGAFGFSCSLRIWKDSSKKVSIFGTWQLTLGIFTLVADSKKLLLGGYDKGEGE